MFRQTLLTVIVVATTQISAQSLSESSILGKFVAGNVPVLGSDEHPVERKWPDVSRKAFSLGKGIAQHPMLYAGEGYDELLLVNDGKVVWSYGAGLGGEIDDLWMLSNGHILFAQQSRITEITPQKKIVWRYEAPKDTEFHSCQPIGLDKVMVVQNGLPPKLIIISKKTSEIKMQHALPAESESDPKTIHLQFRRIRMTGKGTYLAAFLRMNQVVEYDRNFNPIWTYKIPTPWAATRLRNGNTLITDQQDRLVREVNPKGETVWEVNQSDLPNGIILGNIQTAERLANGNTVIFNSIWQKKHDEWPDMLQIIEVTPDKKVIWVLQDWKNLGPATTAQFLDQPGKPEVPGTLQR